ncbi:hypothetical protein [Halococcus agarilyticus]|nr:hypothetical protein [Halococcus agarilyticus]
MLHDYAYVTSIIEAGEAIKAEPSPVRALAWSGRSASLAETL